MLSMGITRFKCATVAEAEMLADCQAPHIVLAYPLIGPNINRYLTLVSRYPQSHFYAIGDDVEELKKLSDSASHFGIVIDTLLDINLGMNRTGICTDEAVDMYQSCSTLPGISMCGLHCYDGHHNDKDLDIRTLRVEQALIKIRKLVQGLKAKGYACPIKIMAGTPSFPCHAKYEDEFLSPGTCFIMDYGYMTNMPDLPFVPAAALFTRVISHPAKGYFTLDLGYKGIAADPQGSRGVIVNLEEAEPVLHSEEHWVWRIKDGFEHMIPSIGSALFVVPTHICPTSALYPSVMVAEGHKIIDIWPVTARDRKLNL
jgi:D-serine deaminase-like pyridoxal phosphate-dependent protein